MISKTSFESKEDTTNSGIHFRVTATATSGDVLLLIMGYGGNLHMWPDSFISELSNHYTVITLDNRGTGQSIKPEDPEEYSAAVMADDVQEVIQKLAIEKFHLLGFSLGGCIALEYARSFQPQLKSLFLMSTTAGGPMHIKPKRDKAEILAKPQGDTLWDEYVAVWKLCMSEAAFQKNLPTLQALFNNSSVYPTPPLALQGHMRVLEYFDASEYLSELKLPTTVLGGADDALLPIKNTQLIADGIANSQLVVLPDCQHYPHVEFPQEVLKNIYLLTGKADS
jgi:3-oxoadipate enol-lactonase